MGTQENQFVYNNDIGVSNNSNVTNQLISTILDGNIRIHPECEDRIEKIVSRITVWHHEACQVMTNDDHEGQIFLSNPHTNNGFFFLLTIFMGLKIRVHN